MNYKKTISEALSIADVEINGSRPWDIQIKNEDFYARVLANPSLGLGESYMDSWWECEQLDVMMAKIFRARLGEHLDPSKLLFPALMAKLQNPGRKKKAFEIGQKHYDTGNDFFERMLDKRMTYTCGYFKEVVTLDEAQEAKLDLVCQKIGLKPGDHVLDIGCGWGSFMFYAAEKYGARCTGITVSKEQVALGNKRVGNLPVTFELKDYREVSAHYDHVVSLGMFEHVGPKSHRIFMEKVNSILHDDGFLLLHTIGMSKAEPYEDPFLEKYIFPNSLSPSVGQLATAIEGLFVMEDWHNFGTYYDTTCMHWWKNIEQHWPEIKDNYSERFYRMWRFFLLAAAGSFRSRTGQLWQVVLSKHGVLGGYTSVR